MGELSADFSRNLLFFFSALGVFNGLLLAGYILFSSRPRHYSNYFLALFFLSLCVRIGKSVVFFFNPNLAYPYLQFGLMFCCFIGPALFLYTRSITRDSLDIDRSWKYHLGLIVPFVFIVGFLYPYGEHVMEWRSIVIKCIYGLWAIYSLWAIWEARSVVRKLFGKIKLSIREKWLISLLIGNLAILNAYVFAGMTSYILGAVLFSFMLYSVVVMLVRGNKKDPILVKVKPQVSSVEKREADALFTRLTTLVEEGSLFLNADLKVADVAKELHVSSTQLSKVLNEARNKNFSQFINAYRIVHAQNLIRSDSPYTMEALGYDSGFNSKSSFYATFKKFSGQTPSEFRDSLANDTPN